MIQKNHTLEPRYSFIFLLLTLILVACKGSYSQTAQYIPDAPDYTDPVMWYVSENDKTGDGADVLYFVSTWEADWTTEDGRICHYVMCTTPSTVPIWTRK